MALVAPHTTVMTIEQVGRGRMRCGGVYQYYTSQVSSLHRLLQQLDPTPSCISSCTHHLLLYAIFLVKNQKYISNNWNVSRWWAEARNYQCIHIYVIMIHFLAQEFVFPLYHCIGNRSYPFGMQVQPLFLGYKKRFLDYFLEFILFPFQCHFGS